MIGEFHFNYTKDERSPEFILILFGLPIMDVAGNAAGSTSHFSNPYCPRSREDWYVPGLLLLCSKWSRWDYSVCMKMVSPNIHHEAALCTLIMRMFFQTNSLSPSLLSNVKRFFFLSNWYSRKVYPTSDTDNCDNKARLTRFSLTGPSLLENQLATEPLNAEKSGQKEVFLSLLLLEGLLIPVFPYQIKFAFFMHVLKIICSTAQSYDYPGGKDRKIERLQQPQVIKLALNG